MPAPSIMPAEYAKRRSALAKKLGSAIGVLFAGDHSPNLHTPFQVHPTFRYFTGLADEPGAILLIDPKHPVESRRDMLFLKPLDPEVEKWDGYRLEIASALRDRTGFRTIFRTPQFPRFLLEAVKRSRVMACLHPLARHDEPISPDLSIFQSLVARVPGASITDSSAIPVELRGVKSRAEVSLIEHAGRITAEGFAAARKALKPGMTEFDIQEVLEHAYRTHGARGPAYPSIVGAGVNSTVLHYHHNSQVIEEGDLICIDSAASFEGYAADVTRTLPASGTFTPRQREVYQVVLKSMEAAIAAVKPGVTIAQVDRVARAVIMKAGYGDWFIHGIGHHLGLEVHDPTPDGALREGHVITIEPGIYIPSEKIGIRIEDDILVTKTGSRNLTASIPK